MSSKYQEIRYIETKRQKDKSSESKHIRKTGLPAVANTRTEANTTNLDLLENR